MAARIVRMGRGKPTPYDGLVKIAQIPRSSDPATHESTEEPEWIPRPGGGAFAFGVEPRWTGKVVLDSAKLAEPLRWRDPSTVFVNSMSDLFHEELTNEQIAAVFGVMAACPRHTFIVLTKRARRMREWFEWADAEATKIAPVDPGNPWWRVLACLNAAGRALGHDIPGAGGETWPLKSVWIGVSVENQDAADERIPDLLQTPAAVRLLSCEPLLGPIELPRHDQSMGPSYSPIDWIICGCESGPGARTCDVAWLRSLRDQCSAAGVPYFLKQARELLDDGPDEDPREVGYGAGFVWPATIVAGPGSKRKPGGVIELPYLDGVQHAAFPEVCP